MLSQKRVLLSKIYSLSPTLRIVLQTLKGLSDFKKKTTDMTLITVSQKYSARLTIRSGRG